MRAARAAALSALLASLLAGSGCYKPNILPGTLECSPDNQCPDNFQCDKSQTPHFCVSSLGGRAGGATGGASGSGGKGGKGGSGTGGVAGAGGQGGRGGVVGTGGAPCLSPVSTCTTTYVDGGACDPVCNVGCGACNKKCSVNSAGMLTCNAVPAPRISDSSTTCTISQAGSDLSTQSDNCAAGQVCIQPTTCGYLCYPFCRKDSDCASANCGRDLGNGVKVCDAPFTDCDPTVMDTPCNPGVSLLTRCFLSSDNGRTQCDCGSYAGSVTLGRPCSEPRDCYPGLVCYNPTGRVGDRLCRKVCRLPTDAGAANSASICNGGAANCAPMRLTAGGQSAAWGYCNE